VGPPGGYQLGKNKLKWRKLRQNKMDAHTFNNYFTISFIRNIHLEVTAVLTYGGNTSHIGVGLTKKPRKESLILKFAPHASHFSSG